jgi:hypothetical protein
MTPSVATAAIGHRHFTTMFQMWSRLADMARSRGSDAAVASIGVVDRVRGTESAGERLEMLRDGDDLSSPPWPSCNSRLMLTP